MKVIDYVGCCGAAILVGFGESGMADGSGCGVPPLSVSEALVFLREQIASHTAMGFSQLVLITNHEQKRVNDALAILIKDGAEIHSTPWLASNKHSTLVKTWIIQLQSSTTSGMLAARGLLEEEPKVVVKPRVLSPHLKAAFAEQDRMLAEIQDIVESPTPSDPTPPTFEERFEKTRAVREPRVL